MNKNINKQYQVWIILILILVVVTPMLGAIFSSVVPASLTFLLILTFVVDRLGRLVVPKLCIYACVIFFTIVIYRVLGISSAAWGNYLSEFVFYASVILMFFCRDFTERQKKQIAVFGMVAVFINIIWNIVSYNKLSYLSTYSFVALSKTVEYAKTYNLGTTVFSTMAMLFACMSLSMFFCTKNKKEKIALMAFFIVGTYYVITCSGRASNFLIELVCIPLILIFRSEKNKTAKIFFLFIATIVVLFFAPAIFEMASRLINSERISVRLLALSRWLGGEVSEGGQYLGRLEILKLDIQTWISSIRAFLIGIGDHKYEAGSLHQIFTIGISGHSDYIDTLPRYGIIGFAILNVFFFNIVKVFKTMSLEHQEKSVLIIPVIALILRSVVGGIFSPEIGVLIFIIYPCCIMTFQKNPNP